MISKWLWIATIAISLFIVVMICSTFVYESWIKTDSFNCVQGACKAVRNGTFKTKEMCIVSGCKA